MKHGSADARAGSGSRIAGNSATGESFLDALPDVVMVVNASGDIAYVNAEAENLFGYAREDIVGRAIGDLVKVGIAARTPGAGAELYGLGKDGIRFPVDVSLSPLRTSDGLLFTALVRAISSRQQTEDALLESELRYRTLAEMLPHAVGPVGTSWNNLRKAEEAPDNRGAGGGLAFGGLKLVSSERDHTEAKFAALMEASPDAMIIVGNGLIVGVNERTEDLFGFPREDLIGQPVETLLAESARDYHPFAPAALLANPAPHPVATGIESRGLRKDGTELPIEISISLIETEDGTLLSSAIRDITERRRAEGEERIGEIVDLANDAFVSIDSDGLITAWNPQAEATFGWTQKEALGRPLAETIMPPRERDDRVRGLRRIMDEGASSHRHLQMSALHRDGREFPVEITISAVEGGGPHKFNAFIEDMTERRRTEAELGSVHDELERRVRDRTREITKSNALLRKEIADRQDIEHTLAERAEELARSNSELEQFAYVTSHDLKEPLRMVTSYLQLLERRYKDSLDDDAHDFIEFAVDGALRMRGLIDGLLAFSRVGTHGEEFQPTDANESVDQAVANLEAAIKECDARVTRGELPTIPADPTQLVQLFQNLIGNAVKFRKDGRPEVHVAAKRTRQGWLFSVRDNGIGIDPKYAERIFVIFQRLHAREVYPGTGIGLAICRKIVERHGGRIWVKSRRGRGATFYFTIMGSPKAPRRHYACAPASQTRWTPDE